MPRSKTADVCKKNKQMERDWQKGRSLADKLGMHAEYGAMKAFAKSNASTAEKFRKLRGMAQRITEKELKVICRLCSEHKRAWGTSFIVEISRLKDAGERKEVAAKAIEGAWGLKELKGYVRQRLGPKRDRLLVGRKLSVNWRDKAAITTEMATLCTSWIRFAAQLKANSREAKPKAGWDLLEKKLQQQFSKTLAGVKRLADCVGNKRKS